jgi:hypothetical protein
MPFPRRRWDEQPAEPCDVLLASDGRQDFSSRAVARAAALAGEGSVGVVTLAKIYGTQFGLPNPWLLPTKNEMLDRQGWVATAIRDLESQGVSADGQVAATRKTTKKLASIARLRHPRVVVIDENPERGWRRVVEGDVGGDLRRKLRNNAIEVEIIPAVTNQ